MALHRTLKNQLVQSGLVAKSISGINSFADLSAALIRKNKKAGNLVSFDPDLDPSAQTYENLFRQFLNTADDTKVTDMAVNHDTDKDSFRITLSRSGKFMEASWQQGTSSVSVEFVEFVENVLHTEQGRLLRLADEDALTFLYLQSNVADAIEEWRDDPNIERWSFWEKNIPHWLKYLEDEHTILPLQRYRTLIARFSHDYLSGGDPRDISRYIVPAVKLPYLSDAQLEMVDDDFPDGLGDYLLVEHDFFPGLESWVADQSCYVFVLDSPLNIVFEATPTQAEKVRAEFSAHKEFLYIDKDFDWSICFVRENRLQGKYTPANKTLIISGGTILDKISYRIRKHGQGA